MTTFKVNFKTRIELDDFIELVNQCAGNIYCHAENQNKVINCKSILGLLSVGAKANTLIVIVENQKDVDKFNKFEILKESN
jgi:phosphotransferase system HPr-like phosphotransfer protein